MKNADPPLSLEQAMKIAQGVISNGRLLSDWTDIGNVESGPIVVGGQCLTLGQRLMLELVGGCLILSIFQKGRPMSEDSSDTNLPFDENLYGAYNARMG